MKLSNSFVLLSDFWSLTSALLGTVELSKVLQDHLSNLFSITQQTRTFKFVQTGKELNDISSINPNNILTNKACAYSYTSVTPFPLTVLLIAWTVYSLKHIYCVWKAHMAFLFSVF